MRKSIFVFAALFAWPTAAMDRAACALLLERAEAVSPQLVAQVRKIASDGTYWVLSESDTANLKQLGFLNADGRMEDAVARRVIDVALDNDAVPPRPDRAPLVLDDAALRDALTPPFGKGYVFLPATDLLPEGLLEALSKLPTEITDDRRAGPTLTPPRFPVWSTHLPREWRFSPLPPQALEWIEEAKRNYAFLGQALNELAARVEERVRDLIPAEESRNLEVSQAFVRSVSKDAPIRRHTDRLYLRASLALTNDSTWVWDPDEERIIGAPAGWLLIFSGKLRPATHPTQHYGPRNEGRRDTFFLDLAPRPR